MHMDNGALIMLVINNGHRFTCIAHNRSPLIHLMLLWHAGPAHLSDSRSESELMGQASFLREMNWFPPLDCIRACKP